MMFGFAEVHNFEFRVGLWSLSTYFSSPLFFVLGAVSGQCTPPPPSRSAIENKNKMASVIDKNCTFLLSTERSSSILQEVLLLLL